MGIEAFHSLKVGQPFLKEDIMVLRLDMMKSYDKVEWSYQK